ncbi:MAG: hypothetical protein JWN60_1548 [Acidobacteria bacterium]|nr:hypothetical protein [Acidobacteriota bacterium]
MNENNLKTNDDPSNARDAMHKAKEKESQKSAAKAEPEREVFLTDQSISGEPFWKKSDSFLFISTGAALLAAFVFIAVIGFNISSLKDATTVNSNSAGALADTNSNPNGEKTAGAVSKTALPDGTEIVFSYIPAGNFVMGSSEYDNEKPVQTVNLSRDFWMGQTEVSQKQWKSLMGALPSECDYGSLKGDFLGEKKPVICVSWDEAQNFILKLNALNDGYKYRLPTEAEWEYAARAGARENLAADADSVAWYGRNAGGWIHNVGLVKPNAWNLYDMHGNVREWCQDWYGAYPGGTIADPAGVQTGTSRVIRGSWFGSLLLRYGARSSDAPTARNHNLGFRVVRQ